MNTRRLNSLPKKSVSKLKFIRDTLTRQRYQSEQTSGQAVQVQDAKAIKFQDRAISLRVTLDNRLKRGVVSPLVKEIHTRSLRSITPPFNRWPVAMRTGRKMKSIRQVVNWISASIRGVRCLSHQGLLLWHQSRCSMKQIYWCWRTEAHHKPGHSKCLTRGKYSQTKRKHQKSCSLLRLKKSTMSAIMRLRKSMLSRLMSWCWKTYTRAYNSLWTISQRT